MPTSSDKPSRPLLDRAPPPENTSRPEIYVVRLPEPSKRFAWEIRRLSAVVLERSREGFATADLARADGMAALAVLDAARRSPGAAS